VRAARTCLERSITLTQSQIDQAVAQATGESLRTVRNRGFSEPALLEADDITLVLDCPFCGRAVPYPGRARDGSAVLAECLRCDVYFGFDETEVYGAAADHSFEEFAAAVA
jgi:hypothetical protein